jgi:hypothetical protein
MITSKQRTEGCIALNKLKLLISEAAYIYDLKSLYTAIETGIDTAAAEAAAASATPAGGATDGTDDEDSGSSPFGGGTADDAATVTLTPCTNISVTWLETKLTELKDEIDSTLTEIRKQIRNNI